MESRKPVLMVIQGAEPGRIYPLAENQVTSVGRSSRNSVRVVNPSVSRFHCEISYVNGRWELHDLNSKKGTLVNGEPATSAVVLNAGDIIRLSTTALRFDRIDRARQDEALLAINEAELNMRLNRNESDDEWVDKVMARNRLESREMRQEQADAHRRYSLTANVLFLATVAGFVALGVLAVLTYVAPRVAVERAAGQDSAEVKRAYASALEAITQGQRTEAMEQLRKVATGQPAGATARKAAELHAELSWQMAEEAVREALQLAAEADYAAALARLEEVGALGLEESAGRAIEQQEELLRRLAAAAAGTEARKGTEQAAAVARADQAAL